MESTNYRIIGRGRLTDRSTTSRVRDQAHLYGILDRLRDFGRELLRVEERAQ
jgi:hypothetical protein